MGKTHHGALPYTCKLQTTTSQVLRNGEIVRPVLGLGPCMLQGLNHRLLLETQTWILEPQMFKVFTTFFPTELESGGQKGLEFSLANNKTKAQNVSCGI